MNIKKERYFVTNIDNSLKKDNETFQELMNHDKENKESNALFVESDEEIVEMPAMRNVEPPKKTKSYEVSLNEFKNELKSIFNSIEDKKLISLYEKYKGDPKCIELAVNEYLNSSTAEVNTSNNNTSKRSMAIVTDSQVKGEIPELLDRIKKESQRINEELDSKKWQRFIGTIDAKAWATRPTMKPLKYMEKLDIRRLIPKNSKAKDSAIIRLFTIPKDDRDSGREIGRIPEDINRILSPLLDFEMCTFIATVILTSDKRLSIGDSFYIQIDCYFKNTAFEHNQDFNDVSMSNVRDQRKRQKLDSSNKTIESEKESELRIKQHAISNFFKRIGIIPVNADEKGSDLSQQNELEDTIEIESEDEDSGIDGKKELLSQNPNELNLDQLKAFYISNNKSSLFNSLPESTKPPKENFKLELRPYQRHGLSWMLAREKEFDKLVELSSQNDEESVFSSQVRKRVEDEGLMNPLWKKYRWPHNQTSIPCSNSIISKKEFFYANIYSGEISLEEPLIKSSVKGGVLADEMGLGKTISTLSLVNSAPYDLDVTQNEERYASKTTLIIVPLSLLLQWKKEFDKANNNSNHKCIIYYGDLAELDLYPVLCNKTKNIPVLVVTTFGVVVSEYMRYSKMTSLTKGSTKLGLFSVKFFRVVLDEGHTIRNRNTKTAKAVFELALSRRWILTGTPVINKLDDLYSLVKFLQLEPWSNFSYWKTFISLPFEQRNINQALDVIKSILEPIFLRRTKDMKQEDGSLLVELPPKQIIIKEIKFNEEEEKLYNWFKEKAASSFNEGLKTGQLMKRYSQIFTHILRLRQVCCHMDLVGKANEMEEEASNNIEDDLNTKEEISKIINTNKKEGFKDKFELQSVMYPLYSKVNIKDPECSICTQIIPLSEMALVPCGHSFCLACIIEHIEFQTKASNSPLCPNCREPVSKHKIFKVRPKDTSRKEITFHLPNEKENISNDYKFQLYHYDPTKTSSKIQSLLALLRTMKEQRLGDQIIVFSQFSSYLDIIENEIKLQGNETYVVYKFDGRLSLNERQVLLDKFNDSTANKDKLTILLLSLKAGGIGLNLTTCSTAVMMDPWWLPNIEDQAIDRIHRIGQEKSVQVYRFIIENSIETKMLKIQERKKQLGEAVGIEEEERMKRRIEELQMLFGE